MEWKGIDVSAYNNVTDFEQVAKSGIQVGIMRITERNQRPDPTFAKNYSGFGQVEILRGVYKFSYALNTAQAREEGRRTLEALQGRKLEFPVFYDLEWSEQRKLGKNAITAITRAFREVIVDAGYLFGIYCNKDWYQNVLDVKSLPYDYWIASYPYGDSGVLVESLRPSFGMGWQYSSKGRVPGISGYVDLDVFYKDYGGQIPKPDFQATGTATSTGNQVNVRQTPGGQVLRRVDKGNRFEISGGPRDGWYHVNVAGTVGYIAQQYVKLDGTADPESRDPWMGKFQKAIGASVDFLPGPETLRKSPLLRPGSRGETVRLLQERLETAFQIPVAGGYDGIFGKGTETAVKVFQRKKGLAADGIVGQNTWRALLGL